MKFETFMKKHKEAFDNYSSALTAIIEKRKNLSEFYWRLGILIEYPDLNNYLNQNTLYDPESDDQLMTKDDISRRRLEIAKKLTYPISYDPEYRAAYKAFLNDVYADAVQMTKDAEKAAHDAKKEFEAKKVEYHNKWIDAENARYDLQRELNTTLFAEHDKGTTAGDFVRGGIDMKGDPVRDTYIPITSSMKDQIDARLFRLEELDNEYLMQHDPVLFQQRYDSEFAKTHPDYIKNVGIVEARQRMLNFLKTGKIDN